MSLVKFGGGIVQMSGAIAGNVFARNRSGNYVRAKTMPVNPNTALQQAVRSVVTQLVTRYNETLTAAQRAAWQLYADSVTVNNRLGEAINLSGINHYMRSNAVRKDLTTGFVDAGPTDFTLPEGDSSLAVTISEATQQMSVAFDEDMDWCSEDGGAMMVSMGRPVGASINYFNGPWRVGGLIEGDSGVPITTPQTVAVPFAVTEGQQVFIRCRIMRADGRVSNFFRTSTTCAA